MPPKKAAGAATKEKKAAAAPAHGSYKGEFDCLRASEIFQNALCPVSSQSLTLDCRYDQGRYCYCKLTRFAPHCVGISFSKRTRRRNSDDAFLKPHQRSNIEPQC
jgi:hypothetical protein